MKPSFIVFDGLDGSGKGTVISHAKEFLLEKGISENRIFVTCEPTSGFYGKKVRELLKTNSNPGSDAQHFLELYVADRKEHIEKELAPALKGKKIVLCDRYKYSTFVYQQIQGISLGKIKVLHEGMLVPDQVFILDLPVDVALERISSDSKRSSKEVFEKKDFLEKVREGFLNLKNVFPKENIHFIDASEEINIVAEKVCEKLWAMIKTQ